MRDQKTCSIESAANPQQQYVASFSILPHLVAYATSIVRAESGVILHKSAESLEEKTRNLTPISNGSPGTECSPRSVHKWTLLLPS
jgi:hypothetical protein